MTTEPRFDYVDFWLQSVSYRGGPYTIPYHQNEDGDVMCDVVFSIREMTISTNQQWRMRTHFDLLDGDE